MLTLPESGREYRDRKGHLEEVFTVDGSAGIHRNRKGIGRFLPTVAFWDESGKLRTRNLSRRCREVPGPPVDP